MDPEQCLKDILLALREGEPGEAAQRLADYQAWRRRGGFEPRNGDARARALTHTTVRQLFGGMGAK
jgi:hypothetical protein